MLFPWRTVLPAAEPDDRVSLINRRFASVVLSRVSFHDADLVSVLDYLKRKAEKESNGALNMPFVLELPRDFKPRYELTLDVHSISAGLDYPGVGPEHSYWKDTGRVNYVNATDSEALEAFQTLARLEGILPALESSHAIARAIKTAGARSRDDVVVVCLSGRGDKDVYEVARLVGKEI